MKQNQEEINEEPSLDDEHEGIKEWMENYNEESSELS